MTPFWRSRSRASTTPIADRAMRSTFAFNVIKLGVIVGAAYAAVAVYGLPGLKWYYTYRGKHETRIETECLYLTFDGPQRYFPGAYEDRCPIIKLFPTNQIPSLF